MIDYDVETNGLQPWSGKQYAFLYIFGDDHGNAEVIKWKPDQDAPCAIWSFDQETDSDESFQQPATTTWHYAGERIQYWFDLGKQQGIRAWNTKFDRAFADVAGWDIPGDGHWHDGMVVAHTVNERRSVALKAVARELFGDEAADPQKAIKEWLTAERRRRKSEAHRAKAELVEPTYEDVPDDLMIPYANEDVALTRRISDVYDSVLLQKPDLQRVVDFERDVLDALYAVEKRGLPARIDEYRRLEVEVIENLEKLEDRCIELAGGDPDFNPGSSPQVHEALKRRGADLTFMRQEDGKIPMDVENLKAVDDELAAAILDFRAEKKVLTTYVRPMVGRHYESSMRLWKEPFIAPDGRIHTNYRQVGARTGRMSSADPNMQNQPRDDLRLRYNIAAEPGHVLVACDLSNIEMVLFAAYAGEGRLLRTIREGGDLHQLTADMLGIRDRARPGGVIESARQRGKTFNFSIIYGGGLRTIRRQQRCSQDHARLMKKRYYEAYPEVEVLQRRISNRLEQQGYISDKLISGRRFRVNPQEAYKATNYLVQGTAASLLKQSLVDLHKDGVPVVALVHDEIVAHVPREDAEEVRDLIIKRLTQAAAPGGALWLEDKNRPLVPLRAEGDIVERWSQAKKPDFVPNWAKAAA